MIYKQYCFNMFFGLKFKCWMSIVYVWSKSAETARQPSWTQRHWLNWVTLTQGHSLKQRRILIVYQNIFFASCIKFVTAIVLHRNKHSTPYLGVQSFVHQTRAQQAGYKHIASWGTINWLVAKPMANFKTNHPGWLIQRHCLLVCLGSSKLERSRADGHPN